MENPIKDNRIVSDYTFAKRLKSFVEAVTVNDPCSEEEKEMVLNVANDLLAYQRQTVTGFSEVAYLKEVNEWDLEPILITEDCVSIYGRKTVLFSCMKQPQKGEQIVTFVSGKLKDRPINKNRLFFTQKELCQKYIDDNIKKFSVEDLEEVYRINNDKTFIGLGGLLDTLKSFN